MFYFKICLCIFMQLLILLEVLNAKESLPAVHLKRTDERCNLPENLVEDIASYKNITESIISFITNGPFKGFLWKSLVEFVDKFGARYSGSDNLEDAIDYMINIFEENNLENIHTDEIEVPFWSRGAESANIIKPRFKVLPMLGLGLSVATPSGGIVANAIVVRSFDELDDLPTDQIEGKIVVFNQVFTNYSETGKYRMLGAIEAAKRGAVAVLVRSVTPFSLETPHAGILMYSNDIPKIPGASITLEDAELLWRMQERGQKIVVNLTMPASLENKTSRNTIGDLEGSINASNIVIVSGHIDTWDVADGAMDNGGGSFIAWLAPVVLKQMNLRPRRTVRTIMWTGEELGVFGFDSYQNNPRYENESINIALDSDLGTFTPRGVIYQGSETGECILREVLKLFASINATEVFVPAIDLENRQLDLNIPLLGLLNENDRYFWYHHTSADTMNVLNSDDLDLCAALWAGVTYVLADLPQDIPKM